ncbi:hypothetical protein CEXT_746071 [Caerostris extrusa]|uniref:Ycf15 n=1 Tax=Caerostris extrusa TaxID=172846 RepID=A0AAV4VVR8_CAEEX|nr:hypothetical protein CEXT_746071 [Caerostris extrusa]
MSCSRFQLSRNLFYQSAASFLKIYYLSNQNDPFNLRQKISCGYLQNKDSLKGKSEKIEKRESFTLFKQGENDSFSTRRVPPHKPLHRGMFSEILV